MPGVKYVITLHHLNYALQQNPWTNYWKAGVRKTRSDNIISRTGQSGSSLLHITRDIGRLVGTNPSAQPTVSKRRRRSDKAHTAWRRTVCFSAITHLLEWSAFSITICWKVSCGSLSAKLSCWVTLSYAARCHWASLSGASCSWLIDWHFQKNDALRKLQNRHWREQYC